MHNSWTAAIGQGRAAQSTLSMCAVLYRAHTLKPFGMTAALPGLMRILLMFVVAVCGKAFLSMPDSPHGAMELASLVRMPACAGAHVRLHNRAFFGPTATCCSATAAFAAARCKATQATWAKLWASSRCSTPSSMGSTCRTWCVSSSPVSCRPSPVPMYGQSGTCVSLVSFGQWNCFRVQDRDGQ